MPHGHRSRRTRRAGVDDAANQDPAYSQDNEAAFQSNGQYSYAEPSYTPDSPPDSPPIDPFYGVNTNIVVPTYATEEEQYPAQPSMSAADPYGAQEQGYSGQAAGNDDLNNHFDSQETRHGSNPDADYDDNAHADPRTDPDYAADASQARLDLVEAWQEDTPQQGGSSRRQEVIEEVVEEVDHQFRATPAGADGDGDGDGGDGEPAQPRDGDGERRRRRRHHHGSGSSRRHARH